MTANESVYSSTWSREQDRAFENALAIHAEGSSDRWDKIVADVPGKTLEQIQHHYKLLKEDLLDIESGRVPLPCYISSSDGSTSHGDDEASGSKKGDHFDADSSHGIKSSRSDLDRRKGIAWTEDEHRLFLLGLDKYGKGDWRSISRNFVVTRTPTQVASHAQKYFIRMNSMNKDRRRSSIHDITSIDNAETSGTPQGPITGQSNGAGSPSGGKSSNKSSTALRVYGPTSIGQPVGSAVGTPVNYPVYGMRAPPIVGPVVSGSMGYRVPHTSSQR